MLAALATGILPEERRASGLAVLNASMAIGALVASVAFGAMWGWKGSSFAVTTFLVGLVGALLLASILLRPMLRSPRRELADRRLELAKPPGSVDAPTAGSTIVAELHDTTEEYLEAILEIEEEGIVPIRARLVERLGLSAPAVSETVNRLVDHGYAELLDDRTPPAHRPRAARSPTRSCAATASPSGCSST